MPLCIPTIVEQFDDQHLVYSIAIISGARVAELRIGVTPDSIEILSPTDAWGRFQPLAMSGQLQGAHE